MHGFCGIPVSIDSYYYKDESKVLQYLGNMRHSSSAPNAFAESVMVMDRTGLCDAEVIWFSPSASHWICLNDTPLNKELRP